MVKDVVGLCAELKIDLPFEPDILESAEIPVLIAGSENAIGPRISRTILPSWNLSEGTDIEPLFEGVRSVGIWIRENVGAPSSRTDKKP